MKGFVAVLGRELAERRLLVPIALLLGLVPLVAPFLPGAARLDSTGMQGDLALILAWTVAMTLAVLLGGSVIVRDLVEKRLGFYFARPLSGWAIWGGKLAAALVLAYGAGLLILAPAALTGKDVRPPEDLQVQVFNLKLGTPLLIIAFCLLAAHVVAVIARSRSPWFLLDMAGAGLVFLIVSSACGRLLDQWAFGSFAVLVGAFAVGTLLAMLVASAVQVGRGRTIPRSSHRALSLTLWGLLLTCALAADVSSRWVVGATPEDLAEIHEVVTARSGDWIALSGLAAHRGDYIPAFLLDTASGRVVRTGPRGLRHRPKQVISDDGRRAIWIEHESGGSQLVSLDLTTPGASPVETSISLSEVPVAFGSPDGDRLVTMYRKKLTVDDLASGRLLASAALPEGVDHQLRFRGPDVVRVLQRRFFDREGTTPGVELAVLELDLETGKLTPLGPGGYRATPFATLDAGGERLLLGDESRQVLEVRDVATGGLLAAVPTAAGHFYGSFLADGRIALVEGAEVGPAGRTLRLLTPEGAELRRFRFEAARALVLGGQPSPGHLVVTTRDREPTGAADFRDQTRWWESHLLDLENGNVRSLGSGLRPVGGPEVVPGSTGSKLFLQAGGGLLRLDPLTGERRTILSDS